jgi:hypothetical protein
VIIVVGIDAIFVIKIIPVQIAYGTTIKSFT